MVEVFVDKPVICWGNLRHEDKEDANEMGEQEVENKYLCQFPILFIIAIFDKHDFQQFNFFKRLLQLYENKESNIRHTLKV